MAATTIADVKRFLWLHGSGPLIAADPIELLRSLLTEYEKLEEKHKIKKKPEARP